MKDWIVTAINAYAKYIIKSMLHAHADARDSHHIELAAC